MVIDAKASSVPARAQSGGHLFGFVSTCVNGAILDVADGRRLELPQSGPAIAMTAATDGKLYALTIDERCNTTTFQLRRIDPATLREEAVIDTGLRPSGNVLRVELVAAATGATYL